MCDCPTDWASGESIPGIRHAVTGADYGAVRVGAFMGYRILAALAGLRVTPGERAVTCTSTIRGGAAISPTCGGETFRRFERDIPETLDGETFLARYDGTTDLVTRVDPARRYADPDAHSTPDLRARARDGMGVACWPRRPLPRLSPTRRDSVQLMYESHASYSRAVLARAEPIDWSRWRGRPAQRRHLRSQDHRRRQRRHGRASR